MSKVCHSVDASEIRLAPVEVDSLFHYLQGFIPGGCERDFSHQHRLTVSLWKFRSSGKNLHNSSSTIFIVSRAKTKNEQQFLGFVDYKKNHRTRVVCIMYEKKRSNNKSIWTKDRFIDLWCTACNLGVGQRSLVYSW